ncbi:MAG TPA: hypothetical protein VII51_08560 [Gaiellaceae bacterium]
MTSLEGETHASVPPLPAAPRTRTLNGPHRRRFVIVYGLLAAVLGAAVVGLVAYAGKTISPAPAWSAWKPHGGGLGAAKEIADEVGKGYHLPNGNQLVDVIAKAPSVSPASNLSIPIHYVALHGIKSTADQIVAVSSTDSIMYSLCGLGASCAIATGKASVQRGTLVRREILELALYTFKYVGGIKNVIAFMPPTPGSQPKYVVYLQKSDLSSQLNEPLTRTLATKVPPMSAIPARDTAAINETTGPRIYSFTLSQTQTGDAVLVLAPVPA